MSDILETALDAIRTNRLRSVLTVLIITVGITSLVGIQTAIEVLSRELSDSFGRMGAARMEITAAEKAPPITVAQAEAFARRLEAGNPSVSLTVNPIACASSGGKRTDPVMTLTASDANWLAGCGSQLAAGRNFSPGEISSGAAVCIIGASIAGRLFGRDNPQIAIGRKVSFGDGAYRVIGVTKRKGASLTGGGDCEAVIPLRNAVGRLRGEEAGCTVTFFCPEGVTPEEAEGRAAALMRGIRRLHASAENDFTVRSGDSLQETLSSLSSKLSLAALAIGLITLLGAAVGLMNILLVSVRERRSEIGLRKALGARRRQISRQFLFEAFLICQAGGALGTLLGIGAGNIVAAVLGSAAIIPFRWIVISILTCGFVSLMAGLLPALRASAMNPAEALGYE
ncbi:MAG: ABC transporter permease [Bacteroidales bacterium]|nr:ABC transporter permease [Bacteroidales bacterium]